MLLKKAAPRPLQRPLQYASGTAATPPPLGLAAVPVRVAGHGPFDGVADPVPCIARGMLGALPLERRLAACAGPVAAEFGLHIIERAIGISGVRIHAIPVGRRIVVIAGA